MITTKYCQFPLNLTLQWVLQFSASLGCFFCLISLRIAIFDTIVGCHHSKHAIPGHKLSFLQRIEKCIWGFPDWRFSFIFFKYFWCIVHAISEALVNCTCECCFCVTNWVHSSQWNKYTFSGQTRVSIPCRTYVNFKHKMTSAEQQK